MNIEGHIIFIFYLTYKAWCIEVLEILFRTERQVFFLKMDEPGSKVTGNCLTFPADGAKVYPL